MDIEIKTPEQIAVMREAGLVVARTLQVAGRGGPARHHHGGP